MPNPGASIARPTVRAGFFRGERCPVRWPANDRCRVQGRRTARKLAASYTVGRRPAIANRWFIEWGLSPQKLRRAIEIARKTLMKEWPLSTTRFRTDDRTVFLQVVKEDGPDQMIDLFRNQHVFHEIIEPGLRTIDFDNERIPNRWWPGGKQAKIVVDPHRAFGQPIEVDRGVPASVLSAAANAEGSSENAAQVWGVPSALSAALLIFRASLRTRRESLFRQLHFSRVGFDS